MCNFIYSGMSETDCSLPEFMVKTPSMNDTRLGQPES